MLRSGAFFIVLSVAVLICVLPSASAHDKTTPKPENTKPTPCPPGTRFEDGGCVVVEPDCPKGTIFTEGEGCVPKKSEATELPTASEGFVYIPPGTFTMGTPNNKDVPYWQRLRRGEDELAHDVTLTQGFFAAKTEITQNQWQTLAGSTPAFFKQCGAQCPVERINWFEAVTFLNLMSERDDLETCYTLESCSGKLGGGCAPNEVTCKGDYVCQNIEFKGQSCTGYRLPSESEWEYMTRADSSGDTYNGAISYRTNNAPVLEGIAWYGGNSAVQYKGWSCTDWKGKRDAGDLCGTHPVQEKYANAWELHDLLGNVAEWTWDWYDGYKTTAQTDPFGPSNGRWRAVRGCAWNFTAPACRSAFRYRMDPSQRFYFIGFRPVRSAIVQ